jgi:hypothetical protein
MPRRLWSEANPDQADGGESAWQPALAGLIDGSAVIKQLPEPGDGGLEALLPAAQVVEQTPWDQPQHDRLATGTGSNFDPDSAYVPKMPDWRLPG